MAAGEAMWEVGGRMEGRAVVEVIRLNERGAVVRARRSTLAMMLFSWWL